MTITRNSAALIERMAKRVRLPLPINVEAMIRPQPPPPIASRNPPHKPSTGTCRDCVGSVVLSAFQRTTPPMAAKQRLTKGCTLSPGGSVKQIGPDRATDCTGNCQSSEQGGIPIAEALARQARCAGREDFRGMDAAADCGGRDAEAQKDRRGGDTVGHPDGAIGPLGRVADGDEREQIGKRGLTPRVAGTASRDRIIARPPMRCLRDPHGVRRHGTSGRAPFRTPVSTLSSNRDGCAASAYASISTSAQPFAAPEITCRLLPLTRLSPHGWQDARILSRHAREWLP